MKFCDKRRIVISILAMEFCTLAMSAVSPALAEIEKVFPNIPHAFFSMLATIPPLVCIPFAFLSNYLVRRKMRFRTMAIMGFLCLIIGGIGPYFSSSFISIVAWRMLFGVGMGLLSPLGTTIIFMFFAKEQAEIQAGYDIMANNIGAIIFQLFGGILCSSFGWRSTYLIYLILIPSFLIILFLFPEPNTVYGVEREEKSNGKKGHYGLALWKWCFLYFVFCVLFYPLVTDSSSIILNNGYGTTAGASILLTVYTLGGITGGFVFRMKRIRGMGQRLFAIIFAICSIGFLFIILSHGLFAMTIGSFIFGVGYGLFMAAIVVFAGFSVPKDVRPGVITRLLVAAGIGEFLSAFIMSMVVKLFNSNYERFPFVFSAVVYAVLSLVFLFNSMRNKNRVKIGADNNF